MGSDISVNQPLSDALFRPANLPTVSLSVEKRRLPSFWPAAGVNALFRTRSSLRDAPFVEFAR